MDTHREVSILRGRRSFPLFRQKLRTDITAYYCRRSQFPPVTDRNQNAWLIFHKIYILVLIFMRVKDI